jgi:hypothetical protein
MNVAYFIHTGKVTQMMKDCLGSLRKHSDCRILFYTDLDIADVELIPIDYRRWNNRRMTHRIEVALDLPVLEDDQVLVLDTDLLFQSDPFNVFDVEFDLFYTTRHFESNFKVNAGVWGFRNNHKSLSLLKFMSEQANNPSWLPYLNFRKKHRLNDPRELDWWTNQDLLCVLSEHMPPVEVDLYDAGWKYNLCPRSGGGVWLNSSGIQDFYNRAEEAFVIHYKELKRIVKLL